LARLKKHPELEHLRDVEISEPVLGVDSALLQLVAIRQEFDEPLNLNEDLLGNLLDDRVVHCSNDCEAGLEAMFLVSGRGPMVADRMLKFKSEDVIYDEEYHPHTFRRLEECRFPATDLIPIIVKRKGDQEIESERPLKREKANQGERPANSKPKAGAKAKAASGRSVPRNDCVQTILCSLLFVVLDSSVSNDVISNHILSKPGSFVL
jgi:hypothetical protein